MFSGQSWQRQNIIKSLSVWFLYSGLRYVSPDMPLHFSQAMKIREIKLATLKMIGCWNEANTRKKICQMIFARKLSTGSAKPFCKHHERNRLGGGRVFCPE